METNIEYQKYIADTKNLKTPQGRLNYQAQYASDFEEIYINSMDKDINLSTAKSFIENLSINELQTIQKYNGLADAINKGSLNEESAYNLLVHDNEQYDFNKDGITKVGAASMMSIVPTTMPSNVRVAYIEALNTLDGKDRLMAMTLTFDMGRISSQINNTPYKVQTIDYAHLSKRVDSMLNPTDGAFTSESTKVAISSFWNAFENAYSGDKTTKKVEESDHSVEKFLEDLRKKGAAVFLADLDKEKIEKKLQEFRDKLIEEMGSSAKNMIKIEELVNQYKKQLLEELQSFLDNDDEKKSIPNKQAMIKVLLEMRENKNTSLEKLLK